MTEKKINHRTILSNKITRKVISPSKKDRPVTQKAEEVKRTNPASEVESKTGEIKPKKVCYFCQAKSCPNYTDISTLRKYLTDRAKIVARARSGACSKHQRIITKQIKYARHLALLPFTPKV